MTIVAHDVGGVGGMERQLQALVNGLLDRGVSVEVVSRTLELPGHPRLRWRRVRGPARPFPLAYPWFALVASSMLTWSRRGLLHTTGAIVLNRADVCTVHYLHNRRADSAARMRRATPLYRLNAAAAAAMSRFAERLVYSTPARSAALVAVSEPLAVELLDAFPGRGESIWVIENGVDLERFRPDEEARRETRRSLGIDASAKLALFVGSEWRGKGAGIAVDALAAAPSWHLVVVGDGDRRELAEPAERSHVADRLRLVAESARPERYYAAADAFVLPSAYESFSLAAFEAAAAGVPVLATNVGAIAEIVNGGGGVIVERDAASVAAALERLEQDPEAAAAMGAHAREAARRFSWEAAVEKYLDVYSRSREVESAAVERAVAR